MSASAEADIKLGELANSDQPSETTRFNPDDTERYGNSISSLSLLTEQIVMLKGFVTIQLNFAEMQCFTIGGAISFQTAETNFHFLYFSVNDQKSSKSKEVTDIQEVSFFVKYVPVVVRKRLPWMSFFAIGLWGLTSDTILSFYDVVSDYLLGKEHLE